MGKLFGSLTGLYDSAANDTYLVCCTALGGTCSLNLVRILGYVVTAGGGIGLFLGLLVGVLVGSLVGSQAGDVDAKLIKHLTGGERCERNGEGENQ